ncbi:hypothetical protein [Nocardioides sp. GXQ0305]|uniref:hypothetical protein n=1 Tax=Nocardioides sp. GXQ0305 TaxID=3423912 RepID=UPI003D7C8949
MSIDERLRTGLAQNTDHLLPDLEAELESTYDRARVRGVRRGAVALAAVAAVATAVVWYGDVPALRDAEPVAPDPAPRSATDLKGVQGSLEPGTYRLRTFGVQSRPVFQVPAGYFSNGGWVIDAGGGSEPEQLGAVQVWRVDRVLDTPCRRRTSETVGPTAADLAREVASQRGPSTRPVPTELDGHRGSYLEVTVPADTDLAACPGGEYTLWLTGRDSGPWHSDRPGIVHHLWILDVDGTRTVVVASNYPDQPAAQHQELIDLAESVRFEAPGS